MAKNNPLIGKLNKDINEYNQRVSMILDKVASWQYYITVGIVVVNIVAFFALQSIPESFSIGQFNSYTISFLASLILLLVSIPFANGMGKALLNKLSANMYSIQPSLDYSGQWEYLTFFKLKSPNDGSDEYDLVKRNMNNLPEKGLSTWVFNLFELHIDFAATKETDEKKSNEKDEHEIDNATLPKEEKKTKVEWTSGPIEFNTNKVSWTFSGTIKWKDGEDIVNEFKGVENYKVVERDIMRKPTRLVGELLGTVKVSNKYYVVTAESSYTRIVEKTETSNLTTII